MNSETLIHEPWDEGAIDAAFQAVFGPRSTRANCGQKTIKSKCGKRVALDAAQHGRATCPACLQQLAEKDAALAELERLHAKYMAEAGS